MMRRRSSAFAPAPKAPSIKQRHRLRLGARELGEGLHGGAQPHVLGVVEIVGGEHGAPGLLGDLLVGAQEQLFLVREEAVEGRLRDVRELGEVDDAHGRVALVRDQLDHRLAQALSLVLLDELGVEPVAAGRQRPIRVG